MLGRFSLLHIQPPYGTKDMCVIMICLMLQCGTVQRQKEGSGWTSEPLITVRVQIIHKSKRVLTNKYELVY